MTNKATTTETNNEVSGQVDQIVMRKPPQVRERLVIERKKNSVEWEPVGHPKNNEVEAKAVLAAMRVTESKKKYKGDLRLVKETREIIDA